MFSPIRSQGLTDHSKAADNYPKILVGTAGLEPATPCSQVVSANLLKCKKKYDFRKIGGLRCPQHPRGPPNPHNPGSRWSQISHNR